MLKINLGTRYHQGIMCFDCYSNTVNCKYQFPFSLLCETECLEVINEYVMDG